MSFRSVVLAVCAFAWIAAHWPAPAHAQDTDLPHLRSQRAADDYEKGQKLFASGKYEAAIKAFDAALRKEPRFHLAEYAAANSLARLARYREAQKRYEHTVALQPKFANGWNGLGVLHLTKKDPAAALKAFRKALAIDAKFQLARFHEGKALLALGRPQDAETSLRKAVANKPLDHDSRVALASALASQGRTPEALGELERVHAKAPKHGGAWLGKASVRLLQREHDKAAEAAGKALELAGDQPGVRNQAARVAVQIAAAAGKAKAYFAQVRALEVVAVVHAKDHRAHNGLAGALLALYRSQPEGRRDVKVRERCIRALETSLLLNKDQDKVKRLHGHLVRGDE